MEQKNFTIIEGATEKELQFIMELMSIYKGTFLIALKSIYNKNSCFIEQKCIFKHFGMVKIEKSFKKI